MFHAIHTTTPCVGCWVRSTAAVCMLASRVLLLNGRSPPAFSAASTTLFAYGAATFVNACSLLFWSE
jgi:hypothetical protein